ncbi:efflux RND transporter permease subunit [Janthinobacterium sp. GW460P]|uniref:efflux RND transporter permease subunit n=1 Tax=unclassified Janthinobacterium TaxID=2610881 RepID=UPI000A31EC44|nr:MULTISPECIES: efflux RND transporter permease subunit [unclassified Janthinobacterium]MCC7701055.1 efflux RND transporter permease subunit [Janthinobacterium sp. GW460P]MCC7706562.1 efflux RND transporter permease subunit [Janthinobacterium sp. GW460W]
MARFFIDRPIFAWVVAIVIMLAGVISILSLPIAQYPSIAPPSISISGSYPGASAKTVEDAVTQVIEQKMKGIDGLRYMSSSSDATGGISITLTFTSGTNPDIAQVQVQNKLQLATPLLPTAVTQQGLVVSKATKNFLMVFGFISENGKMDQTDLSDYVAANVVDPLSRVPGVGDVTLFGSQYAMRIWLDPAKLQSFNLTPADVITAVQAQNAEVSAGELGGTPSVKGQQLNATVSAQSRLQTAEQFGAILLKTTTNGAMVYLKDVASMELGRENYNTVARYNGHAATGVAIKLATGANALDTANAAKAMLGNLSKQFPEGMSYQVAFDTTPFVKLSIEEVVKTLVEAVILVFLVMYLFLQNFRATLIPTMAVPVVLLGTFGILNAFGYSINTLTMFAMVLAIGLLVDDAIVVVENVERVMSEEGLSPLEATRKSMTQITGALVGIAMVLSAVFVPMAFFGGSTGVIYRQFSITIVSSMVLSVVVALVFTPALCATLLKPVEKGHHASNKGFFGWFNRSFDRSSTKYQGMVGAMITHRARSMLLYVLLLAGLVFIFMRLPTSFLPEEDQGILFTQIQLPTGATQERTLKVIEQVEDHFMNSEKDNVASVFAVAGFSFGGNGQNTGIAFVRLKDWSLRKDVAQKAPAVAGRAMGKLLQIKDAMVFTFAPPAVLELGNATGFDMQLQDIGGVGHDALMAARNQLLGMASQNPAMVGVRPNGQEDTPQYKIDIDQQKATALGLQISEINRVLSVGWGSSYVNDFLDRGRVKKVFMQGNAESRMLPEDLNKWFVRNTAGQMVPFSAFATGKWIYASPRLERYNGLPSVEILGTPAPGQSTGAAMNAMEEMVAKLPPGIGFSWTGVSLEERESGSQTPQLYALSLLIVFLCLAALYESWSIPFSVLLVVPLGVIGAVLGTWFFGLSNDVYFQVGLLTVVGLSAKNAILIVEFAKEMQESGMSLLDATLHAVRLRLRPILMTSIAFGLGVLPLAISSGAGSGSQNAIGIGVLGGMLTATFLGIFFVPVFFVLVRGFFSKPGAPATPATPGSPAVTLSKDAH